MKSPFRSIRQKLFNEGKLVRYLGYAVGEIAMIIIGIMVALQLNNWNEDNKAQEEFDLYIVQLKEDVKVAIDFTRSQQVWAEAMAMENYSIIDFLERPEFNSEELTAFELALRALGRFQEPLSEIGLLGELLQGKTDIISRDKALYQQSLNMLVQLKSDLRIIDHAQEASNIRRVKLDEFRGMDQNNVSGYPILYDLEKLRESSEFIFTTQTIASTTIATSNLFNRMSETLESFLTVLEEYE